MGWTTEIESATFGATIQCSKPIELRPHGDYEGTRTPDLRRDRPALFATELRSQILAVPAGFEPATFRLTAGRSAN